MTTEEFNIAISKMSDKELIDYCESQVSKLASSGGRSHTMTVPPRITDTDMLFSELIKRFKKYTEG